MKAFQRPVFSDPRRLTAVIALNLLFVVAVAAATRLEWSPYLAPVAFVSVVLAALFDYRLGLVAGAFVAALLPLATPIGPGPAFVAWLAGAAGIAGIERMRARSRGYSMFVFVTAAYVIGVLAVETSAGWREMGRHMLWGALNGFVTAAATMFLLPVFEQVFNRASRFTLLELTDLNKPVLKRLNMEAHGTYHHSMLLGNIVDAIASEIGADALRARVMAYYHDIGKVFKPEYFAENEEPGFNKHEKITPQMSALILSSHVRDGVELARQEKLPEVIVDGIREHHGTTLMSYFYHKAAEGDPHANVNRDDSIPVRDHCSATALPVRGRCRSRGALAQGCHPGPHSRHGDAPGRPARARRRIRRQRALAARHRGHQGEVSHGHDHGLSQARRVSGTGSRARAARSGRGTRRREDGR